jgi:hypothetical protein
MRGTSPKLNPESYERGSKVYVKSKNAKNIHAPPLCKTYSLLCKIQGPDCSSDEPRLSVPGG